MTSSVNIALVLSLVGILLGAGSLVYTVTTVGDSLESLKTSARKDISSLESKLSARVDIASKNAESVAKATGVPIGDPTELSRVLAMQELVEAARREGKVTWYTSIEATVSRKVIAAFEQKYPFIKVTFWRGASSALVDKVRSETAGGIYEPDVIDGTYVTHNVFRGMGLLQSYTPLEFTHVPKEFKHTDDTLIYGRYAVILGYNTKKVKPTELPSTYFELTDPKWKGSFGMPDPMVHALTAEQMIAMERVFGDKFPTWIRDIRRLNPSLYVSWSPSGGAICKGDLDIVLSLSYVVNTCKLAGDFADLHFLNPTFVFDAVISMAKRASQPNAGKLLMNFIFSVEGQRTLSEAGVLVARPGVPFAVPVPKDLQLVTFSGNTPEEIKAIRDKIKPLWS